MTAPLKLLFTGDSITDTGRRTDPSGHLGAGYVRRIAEIATAEMPDLLVLNTGVSGDRTTDLLARWNQDVIAHRPDVLTILIGANDMWRRFDADNPMTADEFRSNYSTLLHRVVEERPPRLLVLMEPFVVPVRAEQKLWKSDDLDEKRAVVADLAERFDATFIPLDNILNARATADGIENVIDDGVHPSAGGHEIIAQTWWSTLAPNLAALKR